MDNVIQRLIGRPHNAVVDELLTAVRHDKALVPQLIEYFGETIAQHLDDSVCSRFINYLSKYRCDTVLMFLIDHGAFEMKNRPFRNYANVYRYILRHNHIPIEYISKYIQLCGPLLIYAPVPNSVSVERGLAAIYELSAISGRSPIEVSVDTEHCLCRGEILIKHMTKYDKYAIGKYINAVYFKNLKHQKPFWAIIHRIADMFPVETYKQLCEISSYKNPKLDTATLKYVIARCPCGVVGTIIPYSIYNYEHFIILIDSYVRVDKLYVAVIDMIHFDYRYNDMVRIITLIHTMGYSIFDAWCDNEFRHHALDRSKFIDEQIMSILFIAVNFIGDPYADAFVRSDCCREFLLNCHADKLSPVYMNTRRRILKLSEN